MVLGQQQRAPLLVGLDGGDTSCFLDAAFRVVAEVCEAFYDILARSNRAVCIRSGELPVGEPVIAAAVGGRRPLEESTFLVFCDWVQHALEEELEQRWKIEMNGVGVPDAYTSAAG